MSITSQLLGHGPGWRLDEVSCCAGPRDRPFEEQHASPCIALVSGGSFVYRNTHGRALLAPGACLLGEQGQAFECSHEHHTGDRCLSFHYAPDFLETVLAGVDGVRRMSFGAARLAPSSATLRDFTRLEAAARLGDTAMLAECAVDIAGTVYAALADTAEDLRAPGARDTRRIVAALRRIETDDGDDADLATLAADAAMSPYHFLRVFRRVVGMTPRQYQLRRRLGRVAVALRTTDFTVSRLAADGGFDDLSSFERMFRRDFGMTPRAWRQRRA